MYPTRTPPPHLRGDPGQPRLFAGFAVFLLGAVVSVIATVYLLRTFAIYIAPNVWATIPIPLLHFAQVFVPKLEETQRIDWFIAGNLILVCGVVGVGLSIWAGFLSGRTIGGPLGVRYISGPTLQSAPPKLDKNENGIRIASGLYLRFRDACRHMLFSSATGGGKTTALSPIMRQAIARGDRCVVWDEKAGFVETLDTLIILSPWDKRANRWAVSDDLSDKSSVQDFASHVCPSPASGDSVWAKAAAAIVIACSIKLSEAQGKWFLSDLRKQILTVSADLNILQHTVNTYYPEAAGIVADLKSKALMSVIFQLSTSLQSILMLGEFDAELEKLGRKPISLAHYLRHIQPDEKYVSAPIVLPGHPKSPELSSTFCGAVIQFIATNLAGRPDTPPDKDATWLFLDEFPQLGRQDGVIRLLEVGRSKSVRVVLGIQGPEQIVRVYGHDHVLKTILNNTLTKFHLQYLDHDAAQWASDSLGSSHWKVRRVSNSTGGTGGGGQSVNWQDVESPVYQPSDFMSKLGPRKKSGAVFCIIAGLYPDPILSRHPFLSDQKLRKSRDMIEILVPGKLKIAPIDDAQDTAQASEYGDVTDVTPVKPEKLPALDNREKTELEKNIDDGKAEFRIKYEQWKQSQSQPKHAADNDKVDEAEEDSPADKIADLITTSALDVLLPGIGTALDLIGEASEIADTALPFTPDQQPVLVQQPTSLLDQLKAKKRRDQSNDGEEMEC